MLHWDSASGNSGAVEFRKESISVIHSIICAYIRDPQYHTCIYQWPTVSYLHISVIHSIIPAYHQWSTVSYPCIISDPQYHTHGGGGPDGLSRTPTLSLKLESVLAFPTIYCLHLFTPVWSHPVSLLGHRFWICEEYGKKLLNGQWQASPAATVRVWASGKVWAVNLYTDSILRHLLVPHLFFFFTVSLAFWLSLNSDSMPPFCSSRKRCGQISWSTKFKDFRYLALLQNGQYNESNCFPSFERLSFPFRGIMSCTCFTHSFTASKVLP